MAQTIIEHGTLYKVEDVRQREWNGAVYRDQDILVEIPGPEGSVRYLKLEASNEQVDTIARMKIGEKVDFIYFVKTIQAKSGKHEGKWFTHVVLMNIQSSLQQAYQNTADYKAAVKNAPAPAEDEGETDENDLPF